jgi:molecular chaperone Hsp33
MIEVDVLRRFLFEDLGIRGVWVNITASWQTAKNHQQGPENAQLLLGQGLAAVALLSSTIKFNGSMIMQIQGEGDFKALVAQSTHDRNIRGLIRSDIHVQDGTLSEMFGNNGRLVLTIEPEDANPYQGIVALDGDNLGDAIENYFEKSEQLNTRVWLYADAQSAMGLLIQELPSKDLDSKEWERVQLLANTLTEKEALTWGSEELLYKLFSEDVVRLYEPESVQFKCSCGRPRIERTLRALGEEELNSILAEQGKIEVNCEFCGAHYKFDPIDIANALNEDHVSSSPDTLH